MIRSTRTAFVLAALSALVVVACGRQKEEPGVPAPAGDRAALLAGTWVRPATPGRPREGLLFGSDGLFRLLGNPSASGLTWSARGDSLHVTTNSERYPEPEERRYRIVELGESTLQLAGRGLLAGTYARDNGASSLVTGTVLYRQRIALPPAAVVQVTLQDISQREAPARLLAREIIPAAGRQLPIPFALAYDTDGIDSRSTYAVAARITSQGKLLFINRTAHLVITRDSPSVIEVLVEPVDR
jgi:uncharacterized lipoprotein YbaY